MPFFWISSRPASPQKRVSHFSQVLLWQVWCALGAPVAGGFGWGLRLPPWLVDHPWLARPAPPRAHRQPKPVYSCGGWRGGCQHFWEEGGRWLAIVYLGLVGLTSCQWPLRTSWQTSNNTSEYGWLSLKAKLKWGRNDPCVEQKEIANKETVSIQKRSTGRNFCTGWTDKTTAVREVKGEWAKIDTVEKRDKKSADISVVRLTLHIYGSEGRARAGRHCRRLSICHRAHCACADICVHASHLRGLRVLKWSTL